MLKKNTLILIGVFAVLLTATILMQRNRELNPTLPESDVPTSLPPTYLFDFASDSLVGVLIQGQAGETIELQKGADGNWLLLQPPTLPDGTDQTSITSALAQIGTIQVLNELASPPGLDVIGLENPATIITLTLDSGEKTQIQLGDPSPTGNGYYIRLDGASTKLVDKTFFDRMTGFITSPPILPTPVLTSTFELSPTLTIVPTP